MLMVVDMGGGGVQNPSKIDYVIYECSLPDDAVTGEDKVTHDMVTDDVVSVEDIVTHDVASGEDSYLYFLKGFRHWRIPQKVHLGTEEYHKRYI